MEKEEHSKTKASASKPPTRHGEAQLPFRFLDLPAELRNAIYEYAFDESITVLRPVGRLDRRQYKFIQELPLRGPYCKGLHPLLATNRQMRSEAVDIFYARTKFVVCGQWAARAGDRLDALMRRLAPDHRALVSRLCYRRDDAGYRWLTESFEEGMEMLKEAVKRWDLTELALKGLEAEVEAEGAEWKVATHR